MITKIKVRFLQSNKLQVNLHQNAARLYDLQKPQNSIQNLHRTKDSQYTTPSLKINKT